LRNRLRNVYIYFTNLKFQSSQQANLRRMSFSKHEIVLQLKQIGVLPVFYHPDVDVLMNIIDICYRSGLRVFEFMHQRDNKGPRLFNYIRDRIGNYPEIILGAGTVLDDIMTERYIQVGAQFIASPFLRPEMAEVCRQQNILWVPGCTTIKDINSAKSLEATVIGILPGNILGPEFVQSVKREFSDLEFIPSGITDLHPSALSKWFEAGSLCIKLNAPLFPKDAIAVKDWQIVEKSIFDNLKTISKIRASLNSVNRY
jgi:2-dehydro-3-deoxyphosphogluconate aldolase / (4S)-4-hydroxy-2-oxoglutarate aldolase